METLETVLKMWEKDSEVDRTEPSKELIRVPLLHSKYLNILINHRMASKKANFDYLKLKKLKWEYYTGKMPQEELDEHGWEPFRYIIKSDVTTYLDSDQDLMVLTQKKIYHDEIVYAVESIMTELKSRTFQLRDVIAWERFIGGN